MVIANTSQTHRTSISHTGNHAHDKWSAISFQMTNINGVSSVSMFSTLFTYPLYRTQSALICNGYFFFFFKCHSFPHDTHCISFLHCSEDTLSVIQTTFKKERSLIYISYEYTPLWQLGLTSYVNDSTSWCWTHISQEEENWAWTFVVHSTQSANRWVCPAHLFSAEHEYNKPLNRITLQLIKHCQSHFTKPLSLV